MVAAVAKGKLRKLQSDENNAMLWKKAVAAVHEIYLGKAPEKFTYKGKEYTPQSFYKSTGLNPSDYVSLTSYTPVSYTHLDVYKRQVYRQPDRRLVLSVRRG